MTTMETETRYHQDQLAVSRNRDVHRTLPKVPAGVRRILDVGCGAGQTLIGLELGGKAVGADVCTEALRLGRRADPAIRFVCSMGESLPFRDESFDLINCKVAVPYMDIRRAIEEFHRVLSPGGTLWMTIIRRLGAAVFPGWPTTARSTTDRVSGVPTTQWCFIPSDRTDLSPAVHSSH